MQSGAIAFLLGILSLQGFKELPELFWPALLCLFIPLSFYYSSTIVRKIGWFLAGFVWAYLYAAWHLAQALPLQLEGMDVEIQGHIASLPVQRGRLTRFKFDIESANNQGKPVQLPGRVILNWYGRHPELSVGDEWQMTVRLKRPHGFRNPGGFDYEEWMFSQGIGASGYVRTKSGFQRLVSHWTDYPIQRLRQHLLKRIQSRLAHNPMQGIVTALILGYRQDISQAQWKVFRQTGTNHLVAISGLHIGLVAGLVFFLFRWAWSSMGNLALLIAAPRAAAVMAFIAATVYAALAGWSLPTQRALIMIGVVMLALFSQRHVRPAYGLSLALWLVLLHDPLAVLSPGFWLSFMAVGLIFLAMQGRRHGIRWFNKWFRVQWVVGLGLFPLLILFFQQGSLISPLANFIAVPVVSLLVVPLLLAGLLFGGVSTGLEDLMLTLATTCLEQLTHLLSILSNLSFANWAGTQPGIGVLLIAMVGILMVLFSPVRTSRWLGVVCFMPLVFHQVARPGEGEVFFTLMDVGQGLSAVVETRNHVLVFDTGPKFNDDFDTGRAVLVPFLRQRQISTLDMLLVSHGDNDHIGGVEGLLGTIPARQIISSNPGLLAPRQARLCHDGQHWDWDGVEFYILHPRNPVLLKKENNQSCVLEVKSDFGTILLPGDIEREAEARLLSDHPDSLKAEILVAPHHGSKSSSTRAFVEAIQPMYVLFPTGYRNRYRFPYYKVVQRYGAIGASEYNTANTGAIQFSLSRLGALQGPKLYRNSHRHYWHHPVTD